MDCKSLIMILATCIVVLLASTAHGQSIARPAALPCSCDALAAAIQPSPIEPPEKFRGDWATLSGAIYDSDRKGSWPPEFIHETDGSTNLTQIDMCASIRLDNVTQDNFDLRIKYVDKNSTPDIIYSDKVRVNGNILYFLEYSSKHQGALVLDAVPGSHIVVAFCYVDPKYCSPKPSIMTFILGYQGKTLPRGTQMSWLRDYARKLHQKNFAAGAFNLDCFP